MSVDSFASSRLRTLHPEVLKFVRPKIVEDLGVKRKKCKKGQCGSFDETSHRVPSKSIIASSNIVHAHIVDADTDLDKYPWFQFSDDDVGYEAWEGAEVSEEEFADEEVDMSDPPKVPDKVLGRPEKFTDYTAMLDEMVDMAKMIPSYLNRLERLRKVHQILQKEDEAVRLSKGFQTHLFRGKRDGSATELMAQRHFLENLRQHEMNLAAFHDEFVRVRRFFNCVGHSSEAECNNT